MQSVTALHFPIPQTSPWRETISSPLEIGGLYLSKPAHLASEPLLRALWTPIRPGKEGNFDSALLEKIWRIVVIVFCILRSPIILFLALMGAVLYKIADIIKQKPYSHFKGEIIEQKEEKERKLMTLNGCMLWGGLPIPLGGMRPPRKRMEALAKKIRQENPDVLVMQEMAFDPAHSLFHQLKSQYAHFFTRIGPNPPLMESGLFVASKYQIQTVGFIPFPKQCGINRGVFWIETPKSFYFTTHMEFGKTSDKAAQRKEQLELIETKMKELEKKTGKPCFLLGDFNMDRCHNDEYQNVKISSKFHDPYYFKFPRPTSLAATCTNVICNHILGKKAPENPWELDDYALLHKSKGQKNFSLKVDAIPMYDDNKPYEALSDHKGLLLTVNS